MKKRLGFCTDGETSSRNHVSRVEGTWFKSFQVVAMQETWYLLMRVTVFSFFVATWKRSPFDDYHPIFFYLSMHSLALKFQENDTPQAIVTLQLAIIVFVRPCHTSNACKSIINFDCIKTHRRSNPQLFDTIIRSDLARNFNVRRKRAQLERKPLFCWRTTCGLGTLLVSHRVCEKVHCVSRSYIRNTMSSYFWRVSLQIQHFLLH